VDKTVTLLGTERNSVAGFKPQAWEERLPHNVMRLDTAWIAADDTVVVITVADDAAPELVAVVNAPVVSESLLEAAQ
jgi:hypothetical protein